MPTARAARARAPNADGAAFRVARAKAAVAKVMAITRTGGSALRNSFPEPVPGNKDNPPTGLSTLVVAKGLSPHRASFREGLKGGLNAAPPEPLPLERAVSIRTPSGGDPEPGWSDPARGLG